MIRIENKTNVFLTSIATWGFFYSAVIDIFGNQMTRNNWETHTFMSIKVTQMRVHSSQFTEWLLRCFAHAHPKRPFLSQINIWI